MIGLSTLASVSRRSLSVVLDPSVVHQAILRSCSGANEELLQLLRCQHLVSLLGKP